MLLRSLTVLFLLGLGSASAQQLPDAPNPYWNIAGGAPHRYWDKPNKIFLLTHAGLEATDFAITHRNIAMGGTELNPMGKALCQSGTAGQLVFFGGRMATAVGVSYALHRLGLHRAERGFILYLSGDSAWGVAHSLENR
jgi:hypothetical protein